MFAFAADALSGVSSQHFPLPWLPAATWSLSSKARNRLQHALNGNPAPGGTPGGGPTTGWRTAGRVDGKLLSEAQPAAKLRSMGWTLPQEVAQEYMVRVYDTRLEPQYQQDLATELVGIDVESYVVGGDFLSKPHLEDGPAFHSPPIHRWGPAGSGAYQIFVPPRPHLAAWLQRCHHQLSVESPAARFSVCCVVPRDTCPAVLDAASIRRLIPQAEPLLQDPSVELRAVALGERPPLIRVPSSELQLPPTTWEPAQLPRNRVLVVLHFRRHAGPAVLPTGEWVRGQLPAPETSPLELLCLEFMLPLATRQQDAERLARKGLEKIAQELQLPSPAPHQLRNVQPTHGSLAAIFGVPRHLATQWLRGSGCGGLYLRPFWTENSSAALARDRFELLWLRGKLPDGARIWGAVKDLPSVAGLLPGDKDVAVRVEAGCSPEALQAVQTQVQFVLEDRQAQFKRSVPGQRWWRLGPLTEAECWRLQELVAATGLVPLRGELRVARMGPFRSAVYFSATGEPTKLSLDDGSWSASEARLTPAEPPPRRQRAPAAAPRGPPQRTSLLAGSTWAGPLRSSPSPQLGVPAPARPDQDRLAASQQSGHPHPPTNQRHVHFPPLPVSASQQSPTSLLPEASRLRRRGGGQPPAASLEDRLDRLLAQLERLQQQNAEMAMQMAQLREENAALRRQFPGVPTTHQPYAISTSTLLPSNSSTRLRSPEPLPGFPQDVHMAPADDLDPKRPRLQPEALPTGTPSVPNTGGPQGHVL